MKIVSAFSYQTIIYENTLCLPELGREGWVLLRIDTVKAMDHGVEWNEVGLLICGKPPANNCSTLNITIEEIFEGQTDILVT